MPNRACLLALLLGGCNAMPAAVSPPGAQSADMRVAETRAGSVVSIDLCADQAVLSLLPRSRIAAVSMEAQSDPAFAAPRAKGVPRVRPSLERILALRPTMVVRSYGGGAHIARQLQAAGVPVVQLGYAAAMADVPANLRAAAQAMQAGPAGEALARDFDARRAALRPPARAARLLYVTPGSVTAGRDNFVASIFAAAGHRTYADRQGWPSLPLERVQSDPPDLVVRAFFDSNRNQQDAWSSARHPALRRALGTTPVVSIPGGWVACNNHLAIFAAEAISAAVPGGVR